MKNILRDSLKAALIFGVIGIVASLAVPSLVGLAMGAAAGNLGVISVGHTLTTALTFGLFGLLEPGVKSLASFVFGKDEAAKAAGTDGKEPGHHQAMVIRLAPDQQAAQPKVSFTKRIEAERAQEAEAVAQR